MSDERIREALRAVAESTVDVPEGLEARVLQAYRDDRHGGVAQDGGVECSGGGCRGGRSDLEEFASAGGVGASATRGRGAIGSARGNIDPVVIPPQKKRVVRKPPREVVTDFFPLVDVAPPFEREH